VLIDSGDEETAPEYTKLLGEVLREEKATIEHLVLTHWHHDHVGGAGPVRDLLKSRKDTKLSIWKLPRSLDDGGDDEGDYNFKNWLTLKDEQSFDVEGASLSIKYTPGHTTDHACLMLRDDDVLFSGDCILGEGTAVFEDLKDYMLSLEKILAMRPRTIYPGHGPVIEDPAPKIQFYIQHRMKREADIAEVLKEHRGKGGMSEMDIVECIYKTTPKNLWPAAAINVAQHLEKLLKEGKVKSENGLWYIA